MLIKRIHDNGTTDKRDNLKDVTERHITYIIPRKEMPIGLPEEIHEKFLDLAANKEILLSKVVNFHNQQGRLVRQDKYDANEQFVYSLFWEYDNRGRILYETNALGEKILRKYDLNDNLIYEKGPALNKHNEYVYDFANRLISVDDVLSDGTRLSKKYNYNVLSQKISETDIYGNTTSYQYDALGRLVAEIQPPICKKWASGTLFQSKPKNPQDPNSEIQALFDARLMTFPMKSFAYDAMGNNTIKEDPLGRMTHIAYTVRGKPYRITYPDGTTEHKEYTLEGWLKCETDKLGTVTQFHHDPLGRVICQEITSATGELLKKTYCTYNAFRMLTETDAMGHVTNYYYDGAGRLIKTCQEDRNTELEYDALGRIHITRTYDSPSTFTATIRQYDHLDRVIKESIEDSEGICLKKEKYGYDSQGNRTHVTTYTQAGEATSITLYNAFKQPEIIIDSLGNTTRVHFNYTYTNEFRQCVACEETTDPNGNVTMTIHDALGRIVTIKCKDNMGELLQQRDFHYDIVGNVVATTETVFSPDGTSHKVTKCCLYDSCNRLVEIIEAEGTPEQKRTQVQYNAQGLKELMTQPSGVSISYKYDALGRLNTFKSSDESLHYSYCYDLNDNLLEVADHIHNSTTYSTYDTRNALITETLGNDLTLKYVYDSLGRLTSITYPDQTDCRYTYNGNLIKTVSRQTHDRNYTHTYDTYDLAGHPIVSTLIGQAGTIHSFYDLLGRIIKIEAPGWKSSLTYDAVGNLIDQQIDDSLGQNSCSYTFDNLYQLKNVAITTPVPDDG